MGSLMIRLVKEGDGSPLFLIGAGFVQVCLSTLTLHGIYQTDCLPAHDGEICLIQLLEIFSKRFTLSLSLFDRLVEFHLIDSWLPPLLIHLQADFLARALRGFD